MPPSPSLSARITTARYLTQITSTSDQNMSDSRPSTLASSNGTGCRLSNASRMAKSGLVPMSPNTTPMAATASVAVAVGWEPSPGIGPNP